MSGTDGYEQRDRIVAVPRENRETESSGIFS
jgi:hypothetical protein